MENTKSDSKLHKKLDLTPNNAVENGLDSWNNRLEENLEPEDHSDVQADEKAKKISENLRAKMSSR